MPGQFSVFSVSVEVQVHAVDVVVLRPVDGAPGVAHVLVVADVADPAAHAQAEDDAHVLDKLLLRNNCSAQNYSAFVQCSKQPAGKRVEHHR